MKQITEDVLNSIDAILSAIQHEKGVWRGLFLKSSQLNVEPKYAPRLCEQARDTISKHEMSRETRLFVFEDNDILLLTRSAKKEQLDTICDELESILAADFETSFDQNIHIWDLSIHWVSLVMLITDKRGAEHAHKEQEREVREQERAARSLDKLTKADILNAADHALEHRNQRRKKTILIVEDDGLSAKLVMKSIRKLMGEAVTIVEASSAMEAYQSYALYAPDIVFLDIGLPDQDGHALLKQITTLDPEHYIVMLSGQGSKDAVLESMKLGARGFIAKPFSQDKLNHYIMQSPAFAGESSDG